MMTTSDTVSHTTPIGLSLLLILVFAAMGAYSRVYLSQHFLSDVCVGSIIGFVTPFLVIYMFRDRLRKFKNKEIE